MQHVPQIEAITNMKKDHLAVFAKLGNGPVFLAQRSKPAAVLISLEQWEAVNNEVDDLKDIIAVLKTQLAVAHGDDSYSQVSTTELDLMSSDGAAA
ncbi:MAG: hypothetical protein AAF702_44030 [Chloroflexota bacterium]